MFEFTTSGQSSGHGYYVTFTISLPSICAPSTRIDFTKISGISEFGWIAYDYEAQLNNSAAVTPFLPPAKPPLEWLSGYAPQSQCTWSITVPYQSTVHLELDYLDTMQPDGIQADVLQVWNGHPADQDSGPIISWSGDVKAEKVSFTAGEHRGSGDIFRQAL
jgi:hypothetical protein